MKKFMHGIGSTLFVFSLPSLFAGNRIAQWVALFAVSLMIVGQPMQVFGLLGITPINTPSATTGVMNGPYITLMDIHKPSIRKKLMRRLGDQGSTDIDIALAMGYMDPVDQESFSHYLEDWIHETFKVGAVVLASAGPGTEVTITLDATNIDASGRFYPQLNDDIMIPATQVTGKINNVAGNNITIEPHSATDDLGALVVGQEIAIYSSGVPEDSFAPEGRVRKVSKATFNTKILMTAFTITGSELTNAVWFDEMSDGVKLQGYYVKGIRDCEYEHKLKMMGAGLFDRPITNPTLTAAGHRNMYGTVPWVRAGGNVDFYPAGLLNLDHYYRMTKVLEKQFGPKEYLGLMGSDFFTDSEKFLTNHYAQNPIVFTKSGSQKADGFEVDFTYVKINQMQFNLKKMDLFHHPKIFAVAGSKVPGMALIIPNDQKKDAKSGGLIPYWGYRYKEMGGYSRKLKVQWNGGFGPYATNEPRDRQKLSMLSELGTELIGSNRFFLWEQS